MNLIQNNLQRLLIEILKTQEIQDSDLIKSLYSEYGFEKLKIISEENLCDLTVAYNLVNSNYIDSKEKSNWEKIYKSYLISENLQWSWLEKVIIELDKHGHEVLLLKDMGLSLNIYPTKCYRRHVDIDLLVLKESYEVIDPILERLGFDVGYDDNYNRSYNYMANIFGQKKGTMYINGDKLELEFHLRPHAGRWIRPKQEPDPRLLFKDSIKIDFKDGLHVRVLNNNDNLVYECIHANKHFLVLDRIIRNYMDIDKIIATGTIDWGLVIKISKKYEVLLPVKMALLITKMLFNSKIPDYVFKNLTASSWREKYFKKWVEKYTIYDKNPQKIVSQLKRFSFFLLMTDSWVHTFIIIFRIFFMPVSHLKARYNFSNNILVPYYYLYNLAMIILKKRL